MEIRYTAQTNDYMFRYLERYVGTYRVLAEHDQVTGEIPDDDEFEDFYIPCSRKSVIKHTYVGDDILQLYFHCGANTAKNVYAELKQLGVDCELEVEDCIDGIILFNASDLDKVAKVVKPRTTGKNKHPLGELNTPKKTKPVKYIIPKEDIDRLYENASNMDKTAKLQFFRRVGSDFIKELSTKLNIDCKAQMKQDKLNTKDYIHSNGYWDEYVAFVNEKLKYV